MGFDAIALLKTPQRSLIVGWARFTITRDEPLHVVASIAHPGPPPETTKLPLT